MVWPSYFMVIAVASVSKKTWKVEPIAVVYARDDNSLAQNVAAKFFSNRQIQIYFRGRTNKSHWGIAYGDDGKERIRDDAHQVTLFTYRVFFFFQKKHHLIQWQAHARIWSMGHGMSLNMSNFKTLDPRITETVCGCSWERIMTY